MNAIEKRARELYAKAFREQGMELTAERLDDICTKIEGGSLRASLDAIKAALTPPEGFVMVPVEPTEAMVKAVYPLHYFTYLGPELRENWRRMIDARPEIPNVND